MQIRFTKMHGLGNDFVVIDLLSQNAELSALQIQYLADRHRGIGCDQLLLVEAPKSPETDFYYRIFNANGEEVEQCGNGARCFGKFVSDKRLTGKRRLRVSTMTGEISIEVIDETTVCVDMGVPNLSPEALPFITDQAPCLNQNSFLVAHALGESELDLVSMGNPHAVMLVDDADSANGDILGPLLESHTSFPDRVNVGFMQIVNRETIKLRVFERGIGETQACGSGACAAVAAGIHRGLLAERVSVQLLGGELKIQWAGGNNSLLMTGSATKVFDGKINL